MFGIYENNNVYFKWIIAIKSIMEDTGFSDYQENQKYINPLLVKLNVQQKLLNQFFTKMFLDITSSSKGDLYSHLKQQFGLEPYLIELSTANRNIIRKLRSSNLKIPIETGRWVHTQREDGICTPCGVTIQVTNFIIYLFALIRVLSKHICTQDFITY